MSSALPAQSATIFIIDDDFDVRRALGRLLRAAGFKVTTFGSARVDVVEDLRDVGYAGLLAPIAQERAPALELIWIEAHSTVPFWIATRLKWLMNPLAWRVNSV
jgi:FixJ family two-component response regulator